MSDDNVSWQWQEDIRRLARAIEETRTTFREFAKIVPDLAELVRAAVEVIRIGTVGFAKFASEIGQYNGLVEATGWLPHHTGPLEMVKSTLLTSPGLAGKIEEHYRENWQVVEGQFRESYLESGIAPETAAALDEALTCHRNGCYRSVVRLVFPEIETVIRDAFFEGSIATQIGGQRDFRETVGALPAGYGVRAGYDFALYKKLSEHLYTNVDENNRRSVEADPVPNRHAAIHGIVSYSTAKNSINALIMADYMLHLVAAIKTLKELRAPIPEKP